MRESLVADCQERRQALPLQKNDYARWSCLMVDSK